MGSVGCCHAQNKSPVDKFQSPATIASSWRREMADNCRMNQVTMECQSVTCIISGWAAKCRPSCYAL